MERNSTIENAGIDWLSMTWRADDPRIEHVKFNLSKQLNDLQKIGETCKERKVMQYQGVGTPKLFFGVDETHFFCMSSGAQAHVTAEELITSKNGGKCSRIDVQITAAHPQRTQTHFANLRERMGRNTLGAKKKKSTRGTYYFDVARDTGLSLGAKGNERSFRVYSAREGGHPEASENAIRYEWQYRQKRAQQVWELASESDDRLIYAGQLVKAETLGLGFWEEWMLDTEFKELPALKVRRDIEKRFDWYNSQVFPSFVKTIREGYGEELLKRLFEAIERTPDDLGTPLALELAGYKKLFGEKNGSPN